MARAHDGLGSPWVRHPDYRDGSRRHHRTVSTAPTPSAGVSGTGEDATGDGGARILARMTGSPSGYSGLQIHPLTSCRAFPIRHYGRAGQDSAFPRSAKGTKRSDGYDAENESGRNDHRRGNPRHHCRHFSRAARPGGTPLTKLVGVNGSLVLAGNWISVALAQLSVGGLGDQAAGSHRPVGRAAHQGASVAESPGLKSSLSHRRIYRSHLVQECPLLASLPIFHQ
jgi:hypothetical protein